MCLGLRMAASGLATAPLLWTTPLGAVLASQKLAEDFETWFGTQYGLTDFNSAYLQALALLLA